MLLALALASPFGSASAQGAVIQGTATGATGEPLAGVAIRLVIPDLSTRTDSAGFFRITVPLPDPNRGRAVVLVSAPGAAYRAFCRLGLVAGDTFDAVLRQRTEPSTTDAPGPFDAPSCEAYGAYRRTRAPQIDTLSARATFEPIMRAAGIPGLRQVPRRENYRELRISADQGGFLYEPTTMLRIVDDAGHVSGAEYVWWSPEARDAWSARGALAEPGRTMPGCRDVRRTRNSVLCERLTPGRDWNALLQALDSIDVWTIPSQSALGFHRTAGTDQEFVIVELLDGLHYGAFYYYAPNSEAGSEPVRSVWRIIEELNGKTRAAAATETSFP